MASDGYITIHRTTDAAQGELLAEMLRREGIDARFHRVSSALIGLPTSMIEMTVDVPGASEPRARQLIADLEYTGAAESLDRTEGVEVEHADADRAARTDGGPDAGEGEDQEDEGAAADPGAFRGPGLSNRRPIFAAAFAVFVPGAGHLYARRAWTALLLAGGAVGCLSIAATVRTTGAVESAFAVLAAIVACDAIGGVRAARAEGRGERPSRGRQLARGLKLLGIGIALGAGGRIATAAPRIWQAWQVEKYKVTCSSRAIVVENRASDAREFEIADLKVKTDSALGAEIYDVGISGTRFLTLRPGVSGVVVPDVAEWLARACEFPNLPARSKVGPFVIHPLPLEGPQFPAPQPTSCDFVFSLAMRGDGVRDGPAFRAVGSCEVPRSPTSSTQAALEPTP